MTDSLATLTQQDDISIITLDDGKANVFSEEMTRLLIIVWIKFQQKVDL